MKIGDKAYMAFLGLWGAGALYSTYKIPGLIGGENKKIQTEQVLYQHKTDSLKNEIFKDLNADTMEIKELEIETCSTKM